MVVVTVYIFEDGYVWILLAMAGLVSVMAGLLSQLKRLLYSDPYTTNMPTSWNLPAQQALNVKQPYV